MRASAHPSDLPGRIADHQGIVRDGDGPNYSRAGAYKREASNSDTTEDGGVGADCCVAANESLLERSARFLEVSSGIVVVGQHTIWAEKDIVLHGDAIPDGNSVFHSDVVAQPGTGFHKCVVTNITVLADVGPAITCANAQMRVSAPMSSVSTKAFGCM